MRTIGLIGGMSWESTVSYYQEINRLVAERLGGFHSARLLLHSVDFAPIEAMQRESRWEEAGDVLAAAGRSLEAAGADFLLIGANTMHKVAPRVEAAVSIPLLHVADVAAGAVAEAGLSRVGLLGTRFTMEQDFIRGRLERDHGLEVDVPTKSDREVVHRVIYDELVKGSLLEASRAEYRRVVGELVAAGCEGVILGCTEIGLLLRAEDAPVPLFDTARLHAEAAVREALSD